MSLVEIHRDQKSVLRQRGREHSILVELREAFDTIFLNGRVLDARAGPGVFPPGDTPDPPYIRDEQGSWLIQFIGPIKEEWFTAVKTAGVVPVQAVNANAYIVAARQSSMRVVEAMPFIQWTSQLHRFLKPSLAPQQIEGGTIELWIELARTDETDDAVAYLGALSVGSIEVSIWSEAELRVQGLFRTADLPVIYGHPLVFMVDERPHMAWSGERSALGVTEMLSGTGSPSLAPGKYRKWLSDSCPSCESVNPAVVGMDLLSDGFYVGIADTGLDGGDRANGGSSNLHRDELSNRSVLNQTGSAQNERLLWGQNFDPTDSTDSKHDTLGHGTAVTAIAAGDPSPGAGKDGGGFFWALGVAPSAGIAVTKISPNAVASSNRRITDVTRDARSLMARPVFNQNFSLNQYYATPVPPGTKNCDRMHDGRYSALSREFDIAVADADEVANGQQPITIAVSSGNISPQPLTTEFTLESCRWIDRSLTLPPATAKNVLAVGGGELVRPESWLCDRTRADSYVNLAHDGKHGTATSGWFKPDLIAVSANISSVQSHDLPSSYGCATATAPSPYLGYTGTSFAAPGGAAAATLAARRFNSSPGAASPALVKAMLIAGAETMQGGRDRARLPVWKSTRYFQGYRVIPTVPNSHYYEVELVENITTAADPNEPQWPTNRGSIPHQATGTERVTWRDKGNNGPEVPIGALPNGQQGFGRISLKDVLSDHPSRVYLKEEPLAASAVWNADYKVHDPLRPVRIALVWTDLPGPSQGGWGEGASAPTPPPSPLMNDLHLSVRMYQNGNCIGRYLGNVVNSDGQSTWFTDCSAGSRDEMNNVEAIRFSATAGTTFQVRVESARGVAQPFSLVVWNAYDAGASAPPATPASLTATATSTSSVSLTWPSVEALEYDVQRSPGAYDAYVNVATTTTNAYTDDGRTPGTTYLYRVRARNGTGASEWVVDPATTVTFSSPVAGAGVIVRAAHVNELRAAIGAIRAAGGLAPFTWTDAPNVLAGATGVKAAHVTELRTALNAARFSLGLAEVTFTDGTLTPGSTVVKAVHFVQLRAGVE